MVAKAEPARITTIDESYTARSNAKVRKAPDTSSRRITCLQKGSRIQVTGKVKGKNWYAVERGGKHLGYVHADLLEPYEPPRDQAAPEIRIAGSFEAETENFTLRGRVLDESSIDRVEILGRKAKLSFDGSFKVGVYIPHRGKKVDIIATDIHGNRASKTVSIARVVEKTRQSMRLAELDPTNIKASENDNSIALVIGIGDYEVAPDAPYEDLDAEYFSDYVHRAFGVPRSNIQLLIYKDANRLSMKRAPSFEAKPRPAKNT